MNKAEATSLLEEFLAGLKKHSREELVGLLSNPICIEKTGKNGAVYQIEYEAVWDNEPGQVLRIIASIDDGRFLSALLPVTSGFLVAPSGEIIE